MNEQGITPETAALAPSSILRAVSRMSAAEPILYLEKTESVLWPETVRAVFYGLSGAPCSELQSVSGRETAGQGRPRLW